MIKKYDSYKDSGVEFIGKIPVDWNISKLKFETFITMGQSPSSDFYNEDGNGFPFLQGNSEFNKEHPIHKLSTTQLTKKSSVGDILFSVRGSVGEINWSNIEYCIGRGLCSITPYKLEPRFLWNILLNSKDELKSISVGSTFVSITTEDILNHQIPFPPLPEQQQIVSFLDNKTTLIDTLIEKTQQKIELLKEQRTSLINHVVTKGLPAEELKKAGLNPNVEMKDSGVEWIGEIPEHWEIIPLKFFGNFQNGIGKGSEFFGQGYPFMNYGDVYKNDITPIQVEGKVESDEVERERYSVNRGDVFFTRTSESKDDIGVSSTCLKTIPDCVFSGFVIRFRFYNKTQSPEYSRYHFQTHWKKVFIESKMNIVTRSSLSQQVLGQVPVLVPPLSEQQQIVEYLDKKTSLIDTTISTEQKRIELLKEYRQSLISNVVTGKIKVTTDD